ncbi:MAG TPA: hypothetical protein VHV10_10930 [Ktedonobacteraceae bacterium]|jgi:hypothetical protein|nr:hypothetical protein [Ktedonobacteraceae bacterium]
MKKRPDYYRAVYTIVIAALVIMFCIIIWKILFMLPCNDSVPKTCAVDSSSVIGLASAILGIAATLLAFLGAFAVAYWWAKLDNRVTDQVNRLYEEQQEQVNQRVSELLAQQEAKVNTKTQEFEGKFQTLREKLETLDSEQRTLGSWIREVVELQMTATLLNPPEDIEEIATKAIDLLKMPTIAAQMVFKYLEDVKGRFIYGPKIDEVDGKPVHNLLFFWKKALHWQRVLEDRIPPDQDVVKRVQEEINAYRPRVEEWRKSHSV